MLPVHFAEQGLFGRGQEYIGGIIFGQIAGKHSFAGYAKPNPVEMWFLGSSGKGEGQFHKLRGGDHGLIGISTGRAWRSGGVLENRCPPSFRPVKDN